VLLDPVIHLDFRMDPMLFVLVFLRAPQVICIILSPRCRELLNPTHSVAAPALGLSRPEVVSLLEGVSFPHHVPADHWLVVLVVFFIG
jgi:hypothetical protein